MTGERLTEDLLKRLLAASSPEAYLEEGLTMEFYRGLRRFCRKEPTRTR